MNCSLSYLKSSHIKSYSLSCKYKPEAPWLLSKMKTQRARPVITVKHTDMCNTAPQQTTSALIWIKSDAAAAAAVCLHVSGFTQRGENVAQTHTHAHALDVELLLIHYILLCYSLICKSHILPSNVMQFTFIFKMTPQRPF